MTRDEVIARILQNSNIENIGDVPAGTSPIENLEDYPYSLPAGGNGSFKVANAGGAAMASAQSYGGTRGGGFMFPSIPSFDGLNSENEPEYAYQTETEPEYATVSEAELERLRAAARESVPERAVEPQLVPEGASAPVPEGLKTGYRQLTVDAKAQPAIEGLYQRGQAAVEAMKRQGAIKRGELLTQEEMQAAADAIEYNGQGRFSNLAKLENIVKAENPNASESEVKTKAEAIAKQVFQSAEPYANSKENEIVKKGVLQKTPDFSSFKIPSTTVDAISSAAPVYRNEMKQKTIEQPVQEKGIVSRALDWLARPETPVELTSTIFGLGAIGSAAASSFPAHGAALSPSFGFGGDSVSRALEKQAQPLDMSGMQRTGYTFNPVRWNSDSRSVDAITSAAPKIPAVSVPSISRTIKSAAESVVSKLNAAKTNTQKLTTKEKRLGGL